MYGFEAIDAANGWSMAVAGAVIVFSGLVVLSFVISQIHKVLTFLENRFSMFKPNHKAPQANENQAEESVGFPHYMPSDIKEAARYYYPLTEDLGQPFDLTRLYEISKQKGFPHPHITISHLRQACMLVPAGDGLFTWNQPRSEKN